MENFGIVFRSWKFERFRPCSRVWGLKTLGAGGGGRKLQFSDKQQPWRQIFHAGNFGWLSWVMSWLRPLNFGFSVKCQKVVAAECKLCG